MLGKPLKLFTLFGIPVLVDATLLVVVPLFTFLLRGELLTVGRLVGVDTAPLRAGYTVYYLGFAAAIGLFASVLVHEFGHALTARVYGVGTRSITLWLLGGVAALDRIPRQRGAEAVVAIVGPVVSAVLGGLLFAAFYALPGLPPEVRVGVATLAVINLSLAVFNLLPALPLDGGRVLRSLLALRLPWPRATEIAGGISKVLALALGGLMLLGGNLFGILIAGFIWFAVNAETRQSRVEQMLRGVRVRDLMNRDVVTVTPDLPGRDLMAMMIRERHLGFPVVGGDGRVVGTVGLRDLQEQPVDGLSVGDLMNADVQSVPDDAPAVEAFKQMAETGFGRLVAVGPDGAMTGILTKTDLMRMIQVRTAAETERPGTNAGGRGFAVVRPTPSVRREPEGAGRMPAEPVV